MDKAGHVLTEKCLNVGYLVALKVENFQICEVWHACDPKGFRHSVKVESD